MLINVTSMVIMSQQYFLYSLAIFIPMNALLSQAGEYRDQIELLNRSQSLDATKVYETERLLHFCEHGEMQLEYSEELFELFVDHIEVYSRQKIGFALHCGLILKEMI